MKKVVFEVAELTAANSTKVSAAFVNQVKEALLMFPKSVTMRYKQNAQGQLIVSLIVTYENGMKQRLEGASDVDLISVILSAMGRDNRKWKEYQQEDHDIEVASDGENMVMELFQQYFESPTQRIIDSDWFNEKGERYRCVTFTPSFNMYVKFCMKATDEVNKLILDACKPEWMKRAEAKEAEQAMSERESVPATPDEQDAA